MYGRAPYRGLLTHGFTVDSQGRKMSKSLGNGIEPQEVSKQARRRDHPPVGGRLRLLRRHRRRRQDPGPRGRRLPPHPQHAALPAGQRQRLRPGQGRRAAGGDAGDRPLRARRAPAQFQAEVLAHYEVYEFHPVVAKLQVYCSEDLGAFYLDVLKDRLYTTAPKSLARRSAQTALWNITHAMLRWMAPFLSFTAEEAWKVFGSSRVDLPGGVRRDRRPRRGAAGQVEPHPRDPRPGQQGDRGAAHGGPGRLLAAGQPGGHRAGRKTTRCWPAWATT